MLTQSQFNKKLHKELQAKWFRSAPRSDKTWASLLSEWRRQSAKYADLLLSMENR